MANSFHVKRELERKTKSIIIGLQITIHNYIIGHNNELRQNKVNNEGQRDNAVFAWWRNFQPDFSLLKNNNSNKKIIKYLLQFYMKS